MEPEIISEFSEFADGVTAEQFDLLIAHIEEMLEVLGNIYALLIFFTVVLLCFFVYKFFRMFF